MQQDSGIRRCNDCDLFQDCPESRAFPDNVFEAVLSADFWFQIKLLVFDLAHVRKTWSCEISEVCESNGRGHSLLRCLQLVSGPECQAVLFCATANSSIRPRSR